MKRKLPGSFGLIINKDNLDYFKKLSQKQHEWIATHSKPARIFSFNGRYAIAPKPGKVIPYSAEANEFIYMAQLLLDKNPPFYFDVEKHSSGVDVIKLDPSKSYDCNLADLTGGGPPPGGGIYSAKASSLIISLIAYKFCFDGAKAEGDQKRADEFARCYTALLESQEQEAFFETAFFYFGDAI